MFRGIMAELQHKKSAGFDQYRGLRDQRRIDFRADFAAEERLFRLVLAHLARQRCRILAADVGRITRDHIKMR